MAADEQLAAYLAGELSDAERAGFEADVLADEAARRELLAQRKVSAGLHALFGSDHERLTQAILATTRELPDEAVKQRVLTVPVRRTIAFPTPPGRGVFRKVLALAALVMLGAAGVRTWRQNQPVARVGEVAGVAWEGGSWKRGDELRRGPVMLAGGVAELVFFNGARVVLEGPAELRLVSGNESFLQSGKLRAFVPQSAHGFTVRGESFAAVDHGTEFGVRAGDAPEVHVFEGKVAVRGAGERLLAKAEAVRLSAGKMDAIPAQPELFPGAARLAGAALARHLAALVALDFEGPLANRAATKIVPTANGCQSAEGRWPGKPALAFSSEEDRVRFTVPGEFSAMTLLAWVRVDALPNVQNALLMSEAELPGDVHWFLHRTAGLGFAVVAPDGRWRSLTTGTPLRREQFGTWLFLAATFDGATGTATLFVNGRAAATQALGEAGPLRPGTVELGNWGLKEGAAVHASKNVVKEPAGYTRNLAGRMDEFAILSAPLSAEEIHALYEAGRATAAIAPPISK